MNTTEKQQRNVISYKIRRLDTLESMEGLKGDPYEDEDPADRAMLLYKASKAYEQDNCKGCRRCGRDNCFCD